uniref:Uncharacterized protein n=1 Tax=Salix viminalis TaxID=40686 RepID=A0A6N2N9P3_SALVM
MQPEGRNRQPVKLLLEKLQDVAYNAEISTHADGAPEISLDRETESLLKDQKPCMWMIEGSMLKINNKKGNAVVVTTRSKQVACMMETSPGSQHEPGKLSDDQCWSIIKQKTWSLLERDCKKCGGLPLLAKVLGGTLHGKQAQEWQSILNSRIWDTEDGNRALLIFGAVDARKLRTVFSMVDVFNRPRKFKSLRTLKLRWSGITELPDSICKLRHLRYLDILEIGGMGTVKCIDNEFYSRDGRAGVLFPALKELTLSDMGGLEEWMVPGGEGDQVFPCLEKLSIKRCGKLKSIPICSLSSLVEFGIESCGELRYLSGEFHGFTSLQLLRIQYCEKLESIPSVQHCTSLVELNIKWCRELITIPGDFQELRSLKKLLSSIVNWSSSKRITMLRISRGIDDMELGRAYPY